MHRAMPIDAQRGVGSPAAGLDTVPMTNMPTNAEAKPAKAVRKCRVTRARIVAIRSEVTPTG